MVAGNGPDFAEAGPPLQRAIQGRNAIRGHPMAASQVFWCGAELAGGIGDDFLCLLLVLGEVCAVKQFALSDNPHHFRFELAAVGYQQRKNGIEEFVGS